MKRRSLFIFLLVTIHVMALGVSGCTGVEAEQAGIPSVDETTGLDLSDFFIGVANTDEIESHARTSTSFSSNCSVSSSLSNQDIACIIDVPEGDLNFWGVKLKYNVPAGMCRYLRRTPYWFYNQEIGYGPSSIQINISQDNDGVVSAYTCSIDGGAAGACTGLTEVDVDQSDNSVKCKYDLRSVEKNNCCLGEYTYTIRTTNTDTGVIKTESENKKWDGEVQKCIGGAGRTNWDAFTKSGYPARLVTYAYKGLNDIYEIPAPTKTANDSYNIAAANFYTPATHAHTGYVSLTGSTLPYFIDPIDDRNGTELPQASAPYVFECLNESYEIQHRISVYVRDWDVYTDYLTYITTAGVTEVPDRLNDDESVDCDGVAGPCNDKYDLDDFVNLILSGPYDTTTPANRAENFPFQDYD